MVSVLGGETIPKIPCDLKLGNQELGGTKNFDGNPGHEGRVVQVCHQYSRFPQVALPCVAM